MPKAKNGKDWHDRDEAAWATAAKELTDAGWILKRTKYSNAYFIKDDEAVSLVRNLGELNWHPVTMARVQGE